MGPTQPGTAARWAFLLGVGYVLLSFFFRQVGGKVGGAEKGIVGALMLLAAVIVGILVDARARFEQSRD